MRFASLFSGVGGMDLGLERAGMQCIAQVEWDEKCKFVLDNYWPCIARYGDVTKVRGGDLGNPDLLCGGWPCQDISLAGAAVGLVGERSGLFHEFMRLVDECAPTWILAENVPHLLSINGGRDMGVVVGALAERGYGWAYRVLNAEGFGVPQGRRRVFIVGHSGGRSDLAARTLFEPDCVSGGSDESRPETASDARVDETGTREGVAAFNWQSGGNVRLDVEEDKTGALSASQVPAIVRWREGKPGGGKGALVSLDKSLTLATSNDQMLFVDGDDPRRLTPLECERLQGFPDDWTHGVSDTQRYKQIGNAVAVPVAEWIGRRIMEVA